MIELSVDRGDYKEARVWNLPVEYPHRLGRRSGQFGFVGAGADFDASGTIVNPNDALAQVEGAIANVAVSLASLGFALNDIVRLKVYFRRDLEDDNAGWALMAALRAYFPDAPAPVISMQPVPFTPWQGQEFQLQAIAVSGWREQKPVRFVTDKLPASASAGSDDDYTVALLAGGFFSICDLAGLRDGIKDDSLAETGSVMSRLGSMLVDLDVSWADVVKEEGYYLGESMDEWEPLAVEPTRHFVDGNAVATVVPWHTPWPTGVTTKVELLGYRNQLGDFSKHAARTPSWRESVWDWPIRTPWRQGVQVEGNLSWVGGQPPYGAGREWNFQAAGDLDRQTDYVFGIIGDILSGFGKRLDDLSLLVCYFESDGSEEATRRFLDRVYANIPEQLPPITLVPQPMMHFTDCKLEVWGIGGR
jgi:enamine deaminase RidA (YjgF/YER057c/UK114 family)